jgi:hypothetical protein
LSGQIEFVAYFDTLLLAKCGPMLFTFWIQALRRMQRVGIKLNVSAYTVAIKVGH